MAWLMRLFAQARRMAIDREMAGQLFPAGSGRRSLSTVVPRPAGRRLGVLSVTALGVVFGDIGTSPLYAFRACFSREIGLSL